MELVRDVLLGGVDVMRTVVPGEYNRAVRDNFARLESDAVEAA